jgi:4-hydroxy-tetrahydrodipicolinate synthase
MAAERFGKKYDRLFVAVVTAFTEDFQIDEGAQRSLLQYFTQPKFLDSGGAVIVNPEAGEIYYLTREQKKRNVELAVEVCGGKLPVFAGALALTTEETVEVAIDAKDAGAEGIFLLPPIGGSEVTITWDPEKAPEVFLDMAKAVIEATDLPAIVHPSGPASPAWGVGLPLSTTIKMCQEIPNIIGWKMLQSYQGALTIGRALRELDRHVALLRAPANFFHENLATGCFDGTVSGAFCYAMEAMVDHINAWKRDDFKEAYRIWKAGLEDLHYYVYLDYGRLHIRYKTATWLRGLVPHPFMILPVPRPNREEILTLRELLIKTGLNVITEEAMATILDKVPR